MSRYNAEQYKDVALILAGRFPDGEQVDGWPSFSASALGQISRRGAEDMRIAIIHGFRALFETDNPDFDRKAFLVACELLAAIQ